MNLSDGEKLIALMLTDIYKVLKIKGGEVDGDFVSDALSRGHIWALEREYGSTASPPETPKQAVHEIYDIADMWMFIESGYAALSAADNVAFHASFPHMAGGPKFDGFDGNGETDHYSSIKFMVEKMGLYTYLAGRSLNSHTPMVPKYLAMVAKFIPLKPTLAGRDLTLAELIHILT